MKETQARKPKQDTQVCKFWMRGFCRFQKGECRFKHEWPPRCYQGNNCTYWPYCRYSHGNEGDNVEMCRYQNNCRRNDCQFFHMDGHFLGMSWGVPPQMEMNERNFPPLRQQPPLWRPFF